MAIAGTILKAGADYLLAVKANQPTLRAEVEALFADAPPSTLVIHHDFDKGHGRIEDRKVAVPSAGHPTKLRLAWPGQLRPRGRLAYRWPPLSRRDAPAGVACLVRVKSRAELKDRCRFETRYYVSSASLSAQAAAAVRDHWQIENGLHWVLDVVFAEDQSREAAKDSISRPLHKDW